MWLRIQFRWRFKLNNLQRKDSPHIKACPKGSSNYLKGGPKFLFAFSLFKKYNCNFCRSPHLAKFSFQLPQKFAENFFGKKKQNMPASMPLSFCSPDWSNNNNNMNRPQAGHLWEYNSIWLNVDFSVCICCWDLKSSLIWKKRAKLFYKIFIWHYDRLDKSTVKPSQPGEWQHNFHSISLIRLALLRLPTQNRANGLGSSSGSSLSRFPSLHSLSLAIYVFIHSEMKRFDLLLNEAFCAIICIDLFSGQKGREK